MRYFGFIVLSLCLLASHRSNASGAFCSHYFIQFELKKRGVSIFDIENPDSPQLVLQFADLEPTLFRMQGLKVYFYLEREREFHVTDLSTASTLKVPITKGVLDFHFYKNSLIIFSLDKRILYFDHETYERQSLTTLNFQPRSIQRCGAYMILVSERNMIAKFNIQTKDVSYHSFPLHIERLSACETLIALTFVNDIHLAVINPETMATKFYPIDDKIRHIKCLDNKCFIFVAPGNAERYVEIFDAQTETLCEYVISECSHPNNLLSNSDYFFVLVEEKESFYILHKESFESLKRIIFKNVRSVAVDQTNVMIESFTGNFKVKKIDELLKLEEKN